MRIIFVRHGYPDYHKDCLTELGHLQAEAAGKRLQGEKVEKIFTSTCGRAMETAVHICKYVGYDEAEIVPLPFMREIPWGATEGEQLHLSGHPWYLADCMVEQGKSIVDATWREDDYFKRNKATAHCEWIGTEFDALLETLGLRREGEHYRVEKETDATYMLTSHGGSSTAVLAHLFNTSLPFFLSFIHPEMTAITVVSFTGEAGKLISPRIEILNDSRHIEGIALENVIDR